MKTIRWFLVIAVAAPAFPAALEAQSLVSESLASFPRETIRLEYTDAAKLRTLPNYSSLRQRYVGAALKNLEGSLAQLGIQESDVNELALGWRAGSTGLELDGLASGRFDSGTIAERAAARQMLPTQIAGGSAYCLGKEAASMCVTVLGPSLGAFGAPDMLGRILAARAGNGANLNSNEKFVKLVKDAPTRATIWGVAVGPAVADWFKGWMPNQGSLQLDWSQTFQGVQALTYSVEPSDQVTLDVRMDFATPEAAANTRQVLEGVKMFQQMAWQSQNPNQPNPFESLNVETDGPRVLLKLVAAYAALQGVGAPGQP